jgi:hypothetical protein
MWTGSFQRIRKNGFGLGWFFRLFFKGQDRYGFIGFLLLLYLVTGG